MVNRLNCHRCGHGNRYLEYRFILAINEDVEVILTDLTEDVQDVLENQLWNQIYILPAVNLIIRIILQRQKHPGVCKEIELNLATKLARITKDWYNACDTINRFLDQLLYNDLNWTLKSEVNVFIHVCKHKIFNHHEGHSDVMLLRK